MILYLILIPLTILTCISVYNYFTAPRLFEKEERTVKETPLISVLVPARNEEKNISECIDTLLNQTYRKFEIIVLDDNSTDKTSDIVSSYAKRNYHMKLIPGEVLNTGWVGKNWACHQLAQKAKGEFLLFIDADVRLSPQAIQSAVSKLYRYNVPFISVFPTLLCKSWGERLVIPLVSWFLMSFLPLKKVYSSSNRSLSAASGQFILVRKDVYRKIGGHEKIADHLVEDMQLIRNCKTEGYSVLALLGGELVTSRMYTSFFSSVEGFSKNFFPGFNLHAALFIIMLVVIQIIFLLPVFLMIFYPQFMICFVLIITGRAAISAASSGNLILNILLHPIQMIVLFIIGINSIYVKHSGKIEWKGRKY